VSRSELELADGDTLVFRGVVSLENNGGFASVRHDLESLALSGKDGIMLRVKGDGKRYQLRLRTSGRFDGMAYKADFQTVQGQWQELRFPWSKFTATFRGRFVPDAPQLKASDIRQVGFLISDKQEGSFELAIKTVGSF
ncbi:MAG: CIA30 family protein, partial [Kiritimatiellales bacterium]|nr:CIA30 family protein [Kiritimatiellales bacterium]